MSRVLLLPAGADQDGGGDAAYTILLLSGLLLAVCVVGVLLGTILLIPASTRKAGAWMVAVCGGVLLLTFAGCLLLLQVFG